MPLQRLRMTTRKSTTPTYKTHPMVKHTHCQDLTPYLDRVMYLVTSFDQGVDGALKFHNQIEDSCPISFLFNYILFNNINK